MAGIMDAVMGGVGVGVQPKDNPNPAAPPTDPTSPTFQSIVGSPKPMAPQPMAQPQPVQSAQPPMQAQQPTDPTQPQQSNQPTFGQVMKPQIAPDQSATQTAANNTPPQTTQQTSNQDDQNVDDIFQTLKSQAPREVAQADNQADLHNDLDAVLAGDSSSDTDANAPIIDKKPGESNWGAALRNLPQSVQFAAAQMRAKLGRTPKEQLQAFQSMFGDNNVKTVGNSIYFRPENSKKFRKVDQPLLDGMTDFVLFNALNAAPVAANAVAQGATEGAIASTSSGLAAVPGLAAAGAVGGATEGVVRQGMISALNAFSARAQSDDTVNLANQVMKDAGLNAVASPIVHGAMSYVPAAKNAVAKIVSYLPESVQSGASKAAGMVSDAANAVGDAASKLPGAIGTEAGKLGKSVGDLFGVDPHASVRAAGETIQKLANVRVALRELHDSLFPNLGDNEQTGKLIGNAIDKIHDDLKTQVSVLEGNAISLAERNDAKVQPTNLMQMLQENLGEYGYTFNKMGVAIEPSEAVAKRTVLKSGSQMSTVKELAAFNNKLAADKTANGGTDLSEFFSHIDDLQAKKAFDSKNMFNPENAKDQVSMDLYRKAYNSAASDRDTLLGQLFGGQNTQAAQSWSNAYQKFTQNIDGIVQFNTTYRDPVSREFLVKSISTAPNADKAALLDNTKQLLGENSKEWGAVKGQWINNILDERTDQGVVNAVGAFNYLAKPSNAPIVDRLLSPQEKKLYMQVLRESSKIGTGDALVNPAKLVDGVGLMMKFAGDTKSAVTSIFKMFHGDKKAIDYLTDEGFIKAAQKAQGPEIRNNILKVKAMTDALTSKMTIVNVPTQSKRVVQRYAPIGRAFSTVAASKAGGMLQSNQMPQTDQAPSPSPSASSGDPSDELDQALQGSGSQ